MITMKILLVEDNEQDRQSCQDVIRDFNQDNQDKKVQLEVAENLSVAKDKLNNLFDGAIIDLKLADQGDEGNQVIKTIEESYFKIPVLILTGTPDAVEGNNTIIDVFKKGDQGTGYDEILNRFWDIYNTGLTRIMGGRGVVEETLEKVFKQNLVPQISKWVDYGKEDPTRTEKALLRHTLSHLLQLLNDDGDRCFPEEMYLYPPLLEGIFTGSIVKDKTAEQWYTVMTPACDLVIRNGNSFKTDRILLAEIEQLSKITEMATGRCKDDDEKKSKLTSIFTNTFAPYFHFLPETLFFKGGIINFRKLSSHKKRDITNNFDRPCIQLSPSFVKDIVARFSSYYARQGQPDIDFEYFINPPTAQNGNSQ